MNKNEMIRTLAEENDLTHVQIRQVINGVIRLIANELKQGNRIGFHRFGHFVPIAQTERPGRNPKTGEPWTIPARTTVKFRPGITLLKKMNS